MQKNDDPTIREKLFKEQLPSVRAELRSMSPNQKMPDSYYDKAYFDDLHRYLKLSQCIASDDPRLKEK